MTQFEEGHTYYGRFICNADRTVRIYVTKRTPKTIVYTHGTTGQTKRRKIVGGRDGEAIREGPGLRIRAKDCLG